jgi:hypothetical protein
LSATVIPLLTNPVLALFLLLLLVNFCCLLWLLWLLSMLPLVRLLLLLLLLLLLEGEAVGTGSLEAKLCLELPPTEDSDRVTGWLDANDVSWGKLKSPK